MEALNTTIWDAIELYRQIDTSIQMDPQDLLPDLGMSISSILLSREPPPTNVPPTEVPPEGHHTANEIRVMMEMYIRELTQKKFVLVFLRAVMESNHKLESLHYNWCSLLLQRSGCYCCPLLF